MQHADFARPRAKGPARVGRWRGSCRELLPKHTSLATSCTQGQAWRRKASKAWVEARMAPHARAPASAAAAQMDMLCSRTLFVWIYPSHPHHLEISSPVSYRTLPSSSHAELSVHPPSLSFSLFQSKGFLTKSLPQIIQEGVQVHACPRSLLLWRASGVPVPSVITSRFSWPECSVKKNVRGEQMRG